MHLLSTQGLDWPGAPVKIDQSLVYSRLQRPRSTNLLSVYLPASKRGEVLAAELAHDVFRLDFTWANPLLYVRRHHIDFVLGQGIVVLTVYVADAAIEVIGIFKLVLLHLLHITETFVAAAARLVTFDRIVLEIHRH